MFKQEKLVDLIIDEILKGVDQQIILKKLERLLQNVEANTIVFGCTELSLFSKLLPPFNKVILDPLEVTVNKILEKSFLKVRS
jgi:aspartate/glutamate racemase